MTEMMRPSCPAIYLPSFAPCGPAPKMAARWLNSPCRFSRLDRAVTAVRVNTTAASPQINPSPAHSRDNSSRSEARRVGKGGVRKCRLWGLPDHEKKKQKRKPHKTH